MPKPRKDGDSHNSWTGGSVRSLFQKVQRIHELEFLYASFMLSLLLFMLFIHRLCFSKEAMLHGFYASRSILYSSKEVVLRYYHASMFISCSDAVMVHRIFYPSIRKHCPVTVIFSHGSIFSTDSLKH